MRVNLSALCYHEDISSTEDFTDRLKLHRSIPKDTAVVQVKVLCCARELNREMMRARVFNSCVLHH